MVNYGHYLDGFISNTQAYDINMPCSGVFTHRVKQVQVYLLKVKERAGRRVVSIVGAVRRAAVLCLDRYWLVSSFRRHFGPPVATR